ncbi:MAG: peptidoglycan-associated lipoprotein, partial [Paracoccaceae bacterium]
MTIMKTAAMLATLALLGACTNADRFGAGSGDGAGANGGLAGSVNDPTSPAYFNATIGDRVLFAVDTSTVSPSG